MDNDPYFTAGELARIFGLSKQALLYYDKIHLLTPDFIAENGYRHYSIHQYLDLEIIVNLRKLDISISDIKEYMKNRSAENLSHLLNKKYDSCEKTIHSLQEIEGSISHIRHTLEEDQKLPVDKIFIQQQEQRFLHRESLKSVKSGKDRISLFARASQDAHSGFTVLERQVGWILTQEDYLVKGDTINSSAYYILYPPEISSSCANTVLPSGLYCHAVFKGSFYEKGSALRDRLLAFLKACHMTPCSDIYVLPVENHWFTKQSDHYLTRLFFAVKAQKH